MKFFKISLLFSIGFVGLHMVTTNAVTKIDKNGKPVEQNFFNRMKPTTNKDFNLGIYLAQVQNNAIAEIKKQGDILANAVTQKAVEEIADYLMVKYTRNVIKQLVAHLTTGQPINPKNPESEIVTALNSILGETLDIGMKDPINQALTKKLNK
jgi:hypothetical protein